MMQWKKAGTHLVPIPAVRHVVTRVDLAHVHNHAEQVVGAGASQLVVFFATVMAVTADGAATIGVRKHVEFEWELYGCVDLGSTFVRALFFREGHCVG